MNKKRSKLNVLVGIAVMALALVGVVALITGIRDSIVSDIKEKNEALYSEYEEFISPVIMNDPDTFDDVTLADLNQLIGITIWSILDSNLEPDKYEYTDSGMVLPEKEVEEKFTSLFGSEVKIVHGSVDGGGIDFKYSEKKKAYIIPITGITPIYTPEIIDSDEKRSYIVLTVGYLYSSDWQQDSEGNMIPPEPGKYMKITLGKNSDGTYYVRAIQNTEV